MVEQAGFDPATPWSQTKCASWLRYCSMSAGERNRTSMEFPPPRLELGAYACFATPAWCPPEESNPYPWVRSPVPCPLDQGGEMWMFAVGGGLLPGEDLNLHHRIQRPGSCH